MKPSYLSAGSQILAEIHKKWALEDSPYSFYYIINYPTQIIKVAPLLVLNCCLLRDFSWCDVFNFLSCRCGFFVEERSSGKNPDAINMTRGQFWKEMKIVHKLDCPKVSCLFVPWTWWQIAENEFSLYWFNENSASVGHISFTDAITRF